MTDARAIVLHELWWYGEAWRHPDVCDSLQRAWLLRVRAAVDAGARTSWVQRWGRQVGKSWSAIAFALSEMQRRSGIIVRYAALTAKSCAAIVLPTFEALAHQMPEALRPKLNEQKGVITALNGSTLVFAGTDNEQFDRLRGPKAHIIMLDESAFYADLEAVERALLPQLNTTQGVVLYFSSPPETPAHPWVQRDAAAQAQGRWSRATIYDSPRYTSDDVRRIEEAEAQRLGLTVEALKTTTYWRREYGAEIVTEEARAALPAWTEEAAAELTGDWPRPTHFDGYVAVDPGLTGDPHGALFAWHDPGTNGIVVESELELASAPHHVGLLAETLKGREADLWGVTRWDGTLLGAREEDYQRFPEYLRRAVTGQAPRQPYLRVGDASNGRCLDLSQQHQLAVVPSERHDKASWVDTVNQLIRERRLRVKPGCVRLLEQMRSTLWSRTRSQWERSGKDHGDLIDCLTYLVRNVQWHRDCRPRTTQQQWLQGPTTTAGGWESAFR